MTPLLPVKETTGLHCGYSEPQAKLWLDTSAKPPTLGRNQSWRKMPNWAVERFTKRFKRLL